MKQRFFSFVSCALCCIAVAAGCGQAPSSQDIQGLWAEKSAERIAAVFTPAGDGYDVHIGWREPGLAQYEVWEMTATPSRNKLGYKNGRHSFLTFEHEGDVDYVEETTYTDGAGSFSISKDGELVWSDSKDGSKTVFFRVNPEAEGIEAPELAPLALQLCRFIPDHKLLPEAAGYMTEDFYKVLDDAFSMPAPEDGTIDDTEWLYYFVTGNGGSLPAYSIESVVRTDPTHALATVGVRDLWEEGGEPTGEKHLHRMDLVLQDGRWLISDFDGRKKDCLALVGR